MDAQLVETLSAPQLAALERRGARRVRVGWPPHGDLRAELAAAGAEIVPFRVDPDAFRRYVRESGYPTMDYWYGGSLRAATEKYLEHFISFDLLDLRADDVVLDVASCTSPWTAIVHRRYGCRTYRQDLSYPPGVHGDEIGGDAVEMPLADESVDKIALHCSFEHFEGDRDSRFLHEAERVLRPGGKLCILPLYMSAEYSIQTDLEAWGAHEPEFDPEAQVWIVDGWGETHGRLYDAQRFAERVLAHLGGLRLRLHWVENATDLDPASPLRLAAVFTKGEERPPASAGVPEPADPRNPDVTGHLERLHRDLAEERSELRRELAGEREVQKAQRETYELEMRRLDDVQRAVREHLDQVIERLVRDREATQATYEAEIHRQHERFDEVISRALSELAANRATYEREIHRQHAQAEELVASLQSSHAADRAAYEDAIGRLTAGGKVLEARVAELTAHLAAIHAAWTWRLVRALAHPFAALRRLFRR